MRRASLTILTCAVLLFAAACQRITWQPGGSVQSGLYYTVHVPEGWMFLARPVGMIATNDGLLLQRAGIFRQDLAVPLLYSKRLLTPSITPLELAESIADDMRADRALHGLTISESRPAEVGGVQGCRVTLQFHDGADLRYTQIIYACVAPSGGLFILHYKAPTRHYFERDAVAFEQLVASFKLTGTSADKRSTAASPP